METRKESGSEHEEDEEEKGGEREKDEQERGGEREKDEQERGEEREKDEQENGGEREKDEQEKGGEREVDTRDKPAEDGCEPMNEEEKDHSVTEEVDEAPGGSKRQVIPGIVYLGHIPPRLRPRHIRNLLSVHGEVGRIFLQAEDRFVRKKKKKAGSNARDFTEGWVEFRDKRVAKLVAASLNNAPMGTRKKNRFHDDLWNMKYLHRFKWSHLSERLAIERQVRQQRMRAEVSQAKRETNFYLQNVERSKQFSRADRKRVADPDKDAAGNRQWSFTQRKTEEEIQSLKSGEVARDGQRIQKRLRLAKEAQEKSQSSRSLLQKIFNPSVSQS